jgi:hypothetical protein
MIWCAVYGLIEAELRAAEDRRFSALTPELQAAELRLREVRALESMAESAKIQARKEPVIKVNVDNSFHLL